MTHQTTIRAAHKVSVPAAGGQQAAVFVFLLLDGFTHVALASAIEPLRLANEVLGRNAYSWRLVTLSGAPVVARTA